MKFALKSATTDKSRGTLKRATGEETSSFAPYTVHQKDICAYRGLQNNLR